MRVELTLNEIKNALIFLERVDLKGAESLAHAELTIKLQAIRGELMKPAEPVPPPTPIKDGKKEA